MAESTDVIVRPHLDIANSDFRKLDLRCFYGGQNPLSDNDKSLDRAFIFGLDFFRDYVRNRTGFTGGHRVLDLLCGFGRWLMFLAEENDEVYGIDRMESCVELASNMCGNFGFDNVTLEAGDVSLVSSFDDEYFDYVWMYSALQYVDRGNTLQEVNRVLKPGGRLFVGNYNSTGLMLNHFMEGARQDRINEGSSQWALDALVRGSQGDGNPNYMSVEGCPELCERFGFRLIGAAPQPCLDLSQESGRRKDATPKIVFDHYVNTIDFVAEKECSLSNTRSGKKTLFSFLHNIR